MWEEVKKVLIEQIAATSTRGSGNRVALGAWQEGGCYIGEAVENGGVFFDAGDEVWEMLKASGVDPWEVNEAFLRRQLEAGVEQVDFVSGNVDTLLRKFQDFADADVPHRIRELRWLMQNAEEYGYIRIGNSWLLNSLP